MATESWERETKERIDYCLNCEIPEYLCRGYGMCVLREGKRKYKQMQNEIRELILKGYKRTQITRKLGITYNDLQTAIKRMLKSGMLTKEQAEMSYSNKRKQK